MERMCMQKWWHRRESQVKCTEIGKEIELTDHEEFVGQIRDYEDREESSANLRGVLHHVKRATTSLGRRGGKRPNVVFLSMDSMGANHLGCYGYGRETSTHIDGLATSGVLFENVVAQSNWTKPSLASMLTSLYPLVHKADSKGESGVPILLQNPRQANVLSDRFWTLAQEFKQGGYATAGFTNGGYAHSFFGFGQGFDHYDNYAGGMKSTLYRLLRWILANRESPFFAYSHCWDTHFPYLDCPPYDRMFIKHGEQLVLDRETRAQIHRGMRFPTQGEIEFLKGLFDGGIHYVDEQIGALLQELKQLNLLDNTIVVITADHGEAFMEHEILEHTECMYREVLHVPLILHGPGLDGGRRIGRQVRSIDIMPTLLDLCGLVHKAEIQGVSLLPWIHGGRNDNLVAVSETERGGGQKSISDGHYKMIHKTRESRVELYDMVADPKEKIDLSATHPSVCQRMDAFFSTWQNETEGLSQRYWSESAEVESDEMNPDVMSRLRDLGYLE